MKDKIGDKIKQYEKTITGIKLDSTIPIIIRLDGNNFSQFTKSLNKPFDIKFNELMQEVTKFALKETGYTFAYTQSDEITLVYIPKHNLNSSTYHDGKVYKILSKLSSKVSVYFNKLLPVYLPTKINESPIFDCRIFNVPNMDIVYEVLLWRFKDARRNSILNMGYWKLSHKQIINKNTSEVIELLKSNNFYWDNEPIEFKYGTFFKSETIKSKLSIEELNILPEKHNAHKNPELEFERNIINKTLIDNFENLKKIIQ